MTEARTEPKGVMNRRRGTGVRYRTRADVEKEALFCARGNRHFCTSPRFPLSSPSIVHSTRYFDHHLVSIEILHGLQRGLPLSREQLGVTSVVCSCG